MANNPDAAVPQNTIRLRIAVVKSHALEWSRKELREYMKKRHVRATEGVIAEVSGEATQLGMLDGGLDQPLFIPQFAWLCGVTQRRARIFLGEGRVDAVQRGRAWAVSKRSAIKFAEGDRYPGNPTGKPRVAKETTKS